MSSHLASHAESMKMPNGADIKRGLSILEYQTVDDDRREAQAILDRALRGERVVVKAFSGEEARSRRDSRVANGPTGSDGTIIGAAASATDITEPKRTEKQFGEGDDTFKYIFDSSPLGMSITLPTGEIHVNEAFRRMVGYSQAQLEHTRWQDITVPEDIDATRQQVDSILAGERDQASFVKRFRHKNGSIVWARLATRLRRDEAGVPLYFVTAITDITEHKLTDEALAASEERCRIMGEAVDYGVWAADGEGRATYISPSFCDLVGRSFEEIREFGWLDALVPEQREEVERQWMHSVGTGEPFEHEYHLVAKTGEIRIVLARGNPAVNGAGEIVAWAGINLDITERRRDEEALRRSEAQLRALIDTLPDLVWLKDPEGVYLSCNRRFETFFGAPEKDIVGKTDHDFVEADLADSFRQRDQATMAAAAPTANEEEIVFAHDGHREVLETVQTSVRASDGRLIGVLGVGRDITERKQAEDALRESEERFEEFAGHFPGYLYMHDEERRFVYMNRREEMDGDMPRAAWLAKTPSQLWAGQNAVRAEARIQRALDGEVVDDVEHWTSPGLNMYLHSLYFPIPRTGKPPLVGGISVDVTEQVEARAAERRQADRLRRTVDGAVLAMSHIVESRDPYTAGHQRRVAELTTAIGGELGMKADELDTLRLAATIHDIGKVAVPAEILSKPGRLSRVEFDLIKQHSATAFKILEAIDFGRPVAEMVHQHHERLDGSGYPQALSGQDILPEARILAVADVVEAMSSDRPYRAALGMEAALAEVREHAGVKYDAEAVAACVRLVEVRGFQFAP